MKVQKLGKGRFGVVSATGVVLSEHATAKLAAAAMAVTVEPVAPVDPAPAAAVDPAVDPAPAPADPNVDAANILLGDPNAVAPVDRAARLKAGALKAWDTRRAKAAAGTGSDPSASAKKAWETIRANRAAAAAAKEAAEAASAPAPATVAA